MDSHERSRTRHKTPDVDKTTHLVGTFAPKNRVNGTTVTPHDWGPPRNRFNARLNLRLPRPVDDGLIMEGPAEWVFPPGEEEAGRHLLQPSSRAGSYGKLSGLVIVR